MRCSTLRGTFCSLITLATPRQDWTGSNPSRREGGGCGFTLSRSRSCCAVRLVYTQISPGHIWTTLYLLFCIALCFCILCTVFLYCFLYVYLFLCGPGSVVGIATAYGPDGSGIESRWWARFSAPVQTGPDAHPASCTMGTGTFPGVRCGRRVMLSPQPLLVPR